MNTPLPIVLAEHPILLQEATDFEGRFITVADNFSHNFQEKHKLLTFNKKSVETDPFFKKSKLSIQPSLRAGQGLLCLILTIPKDLAFDSDTIKEIKKKFLTAKNKEEVRISTAIKEQAENSKKQLEPGQENEKLREEHTQKPVLTTKEIKDAQDYKDISKKHDVPISNELRKTSIKEINKAQDFLVKHPAEVHFTVKVVKNGPSNNFHAEIRIEENLTLLPYLTIKLKGRYDSFIFYLAMTYKTAGTLKFADPDALNSTKLTSHSVFEYAEYDFPNLKEENSSIQQAIAEFFEDYNIKSQFELKPQS